MKIGSLGGGGGGGRVYGKSRRRVRLLEDATI